MQPDPEYLRQHYHSLSDEGLLAIERSDLVAIAQQVYDAEVAARGLASSGGKSWKPAGERTVARQAPAAPVEVADAGSGEKPEWLDESAEVYSAAVYPGAVEAPGVLAARDALEAAGIPAYMEVIEEEEEKSHAPAPTHRWRVMVPGNLNLQATSTLDRDIFNQEFEDQWRIHLEGFSDQELLAMNPEVVFCGLFDRVERVVRTYEEEVSRRRLK